MSGQSKAHIVVGGLVQGVFYRSNTKETALALGLAGWAKNLRGGDVEIVVEGEKAQIEKLIEWCRHGPPVAKVTSLDVEWKEARGEFNSFSIRF